MPLIITYYAPHASAAEKSKTYTLGEGVKVIVDDAPDYHDGQLESLARKVEALTEIVSKMADALRDHISDEDLKAIISFPLMVEEDT